MVLQHIFLVKLISSNFVVIIFQKMQKKYWQNANKVLYYYSNAESTYQSRYAGVAKLADARDLKSRGTQIPYRFDPGFRHHIYRGVEQPGSSLGS